MRNLKKVLALAVASVMLMGMMVVGTSAAYSDVADTDNVEAIEVLKMVGVMAGDDKGNFNPAKAVTRNEMAVVMSNLLDLDVEDYSGSTPFTDVPAWAEPYVAACYANGIVSGTSATTYGGEGTVTTAQAGLMIMKALGYFQYASDFGDDWMLSTVKQASKISLFDGVATKANANLTRNDVAQLVLNALECGIVEPTGTPGTVIEGNGLTITTGSSVTYGYTTDPATALYEDLYDGDLEKDEDEFDAYGRPATKWTYDDATVTVTEAPLAVYASADMDEDTLADDFEDWAITEDVVYNGSLYDGEYAVYGKPGVTVEVYGDKDDEIIDTIVAIEYYVAEVTTVTTDEDDAVEAVDVTVYLPGTTPKVIAIDVEDDEDAYALVKGYEEDDFLMVCVAQAWDADGDGNIDEDADADDYLLAVDDVKTVEGEVTATSLDGGNNGWIKIDGTKYETAWVYAGAAADIAREAEGTYYLYNGFVVYADTTGADTDDVYAVVLQAGTEETWNSEVHKAKILKMDGTTEVIETTVEANAWDIVTVEYDEDEEAYVLDTVDAVDVEDEAVCTIEKGKVAIVDDEDAVVATTNGKTVYLLIELDDEAAFDEAKAYTGYKNVASADVISLVTIGDTTAEYVIAIYDSAIDSDSDDLIYVVGASQSTNAIIDELGTYYTYTALVEGKVVEIMAADAGLDGLYKEATISNDGIYTSLTPAVEDTDFVAAADVDFEKAANDVITINDVELAYADDCALYVVDGKKITAGSITKNYFDIDVTFTVNDEGEIDLIFVEK